MKRLFSLLITSVIVLCGFAPGALALDEVEALRTAKSLLTEVYGYTAEDAATFEFHSQDAGEYLLITFYPQSHPDWIFSVEVNKKDGVFGNAVIPFNSDYQYYPGQNSVMGLLYAARDGGWFSRWDQAAMDEMMEQINVMDISPVSRLSMGLERGTITAAQAVKAFFESCYGDALGWSTAVEQMLEEVLAAEELTLETSSRSITQGVNTYTITPVKEFYSGPVTVTEFAGETPEMLAKAFSHPKLEGWSLLCGAVKTLDNDAREERSSKNNGVAAFEKGDERLLVTLTKPETDKDWEVLPVSEKALLPGRALTITCDAEEGLFELNYPISDSEWECFRVAVQYLKKAEADARQTLCKLVDYRHINNATGDGTVIGAQPFVQNDEKGWYHVTTYREGQPAQKEFFGKIVPGYLDYIDAQTFPKTAEACAAHEDYIPPDNYGVGRGVHLREKTSSRSTDFGTYNASALVEILETVPGNPDPWVHVRVGSIEGYMSSVYVDYPETVGKTGLLSERVPVPVAMTLKRVELKKGVSWFDGTVKELPAGTKMHVMGLRDEWLHVMLPADGEPGWQMDVNGTDGYVKKGDVVMEATAQQLDWHQ